MWYQCVDCIFGTNSSLQKNYHLEEYPDHVVLAEHDEEFDDYYK